MTDMNQAVADAVQAAMAKHDGPASSGRGLAAAVGLSHTTLLRRLTGKVPITVGLLVEIAEALGVRPVDILPVLDVTGYTATAQPNAREVTVSDVLAVAQASGRAATELVVELG